MPAVAFEVECETRFGDRVVVAGSSAQTGQWSPEASPLELTTGPNTYPRWQGSCALDQDQQLEFKFVVLCGGGGVRWEERISNRRLSVCKRDVALQARFNCNEILESKEVSEPATSSKLEDEAVASPRSEAEESPRYRRRILEYTWPIEEIRPGCWRVASYDDISSIYSELDREHQSWADALASEDVFPDELEAPSCGASASAAAVLPDTSQEQRHATVQKHDSSKDSWSTVSSSEDHQGTVTPGDETSKSSWTTASLSGDSFCEASVSAQVSVRDPGRMPRERVETNSVSDVCSKSSWAASSSSGDETDGVSTRASTSCASTPGASSCSLESMAFCLAKAPKKPQERFVMASWRARGDLSGGAAAAQTPWKDQWPRPPPSMPPPLPMLEAATASRSRRAHSQDQSRRVDLPLPAPTPLPDAVTDPGTMARTPCKELLTLPVCQSRNRRYAEPQMRSLAD